MAGSTIPAAIDALVALFAAVGVPGLQVIDGPVGEDVSNNFLAVGWDRSGEEAVTFTNTPAGADPRRGRESYEITNLLSYWLGDGEDLAAVRSNLFTAYNALADALAGGIRLDGNVLTAWPSAGALSADLSVGGIYVNLRFTVSCQAIR